MLKRENFDVRVNGLDIDVAGLEVMDVTETEFLAGLKALDGSAYLSATAGATDGTWTLVGAADDPDHADAATQPYQYAKYNNGTLDAYLDLKDGVLSISADPADDIDLGVREASRQKTASELSGVHLSLNAAGDLELHGFTGDAAALAALEIEIDWVDVDAADGNETDRPWDPWVVDLYSGSSGG